MITKPSAGYQAVASGVLKCSDCIMYRDPQKCTLVRGKISPDGYCNHWESKLTKALSFLDVMKQSDARPAQVGGSIAPGEEPVSSPLPLEKKNKKLRLRGLAALVDAMHHAHPTGEHPTQVHYRGRTYKMGIHKNEPGVSDVHISAALGEPVKDKKKAKPFKAFLSGDKVPVALPVDTNVNKIYGKGKDLPATVKDKLKGKKRRQWRDVWNSSYARHGDESRAFAEAWATVEKGLDALSKPPLRGVGGRQLEAFDQGTLYAPFRHDPAALAYLRADQVPRFLDAVTHPKRLVKINVPLDQLTAIKNRVRRETVQKHLDNYDDTKSPIVVRMNDALYIADGHDRLAAYWLNGDNEAEVRFDDLEPYDERKPDPKHAHEGTRFDLLKGVDGRELACYRNGTLAVPFVYDPSFMAKLRPDQVPKFLDALTHQDDQGETILPLNSLVAIQDRINADTVAAHVESPSEELPIIVRMNGADYIADGHDRLTAKWLQGQDTVAVKLKDISEQNNLMKQVQRFDVPIEIKKVDIDKQMIFGWASVATKDGKSIIDKQGDIIPIEELENAAYDYVLNSRVGGDMHVRKGVSHCIESIVFSKEKQDILGVDLGMEGWFVGFYVEDPTTWALCRAGDYAEFSVGGVAIPKSIDC